MLKFKRKFRLLKVNSILEVYDMINAYKILVENLVKKKCRRITCIWEGNFKRISSHELDLSGSKHGLWQALVKEIKINK